MRITSNILSQNLLRSLQTSSGRMTTLQNSISTGQNIAKPSDDPVKISVILGLKSTISSMKQWQTNASEALNYLDSTESVLGNMTAMLQRIRELTVQAANGTNGDDDLEVIKQEVDQLTEQLQILANNKIEAKYIFAGTMTDREPMPVFPLSATDPWQGNSKSLSVEVGANITMGISVDGREIFGIDATGTTSTFFDTLSNLSTALDTGNQAGIQTALGEIDNHLKTLINVRAELGARTSRMEKISDQLDTAVINTKTNLSNLQDTDMSAAILEYNSTMNTFRAALSIGSQIIKPSLVDFLQ